MYRRIAVLASLAVVAAMFVGSSTANASHETGNGGVCVFTGLAGGLSPQIESIQSDIGNPPDPIDAITSIERGSYQFGGDATCAGRVGPRVFAPNPTVSLTNARITSNGFYDNILCGTGFAHDHTGANTNVAVTSGVVVDTSTVPPTVNPNGSGPAITGVGYEIPFVAGNGALLIGLPAPLNNLSAAVTGTGAHHPHPGVSGGYVGAGYVHIQPRAPGNCVTTDVSAFDVAGAFVAVGKPLAHPPL
jgi:hypothetical protein